ncbi:MAG TPA: hypothetical protein VMU30_11370 [Bacteroidota bacterium]|nr:hypothetical protein [Bacteroidota bacterium]
MKKFIVPLVVLFIAGCAIFQPANTSYRIRTTVDTSDGAILNTLVNNLLNEKMMSNEMLFLNVQQRIKGIDTTYFFIIDYTTTHHWFSSIDRETLVLHVNGAHLEFSSDGKMNHRDVENQVHETSYYAVTLDQLYQIAHATMVDVNLSTIQYFEVRHFTGINLSDLQHFLAEYAHR